MYMSIRAGSPSRAEATALRILPETGGMAGVLTMD